MPRRQFRHEIYYCCFLFAILISRYHQIIDNHRPNALIRKANKYFIPVVP